MADLNLLQSEADALIAMEKIKIDDTKWDYPPGSGKAIIPLVSRDKRENFLLDMRLGKIDLLKGTLQNRGRQVVVLVRLDYGGAPHRNPDGKEIPSPHLHLYREGYGDKWASPVRLEVFSDIKNGWQTLLDFMKYCHIVESPNFEKGVFTC